MLHETLKSIRKQKGISQAELADRLGIVRQTVSKWEKGYSVPDADMLLKLAGILEIPANELLGLSAEQPAGQDEIVRHLTQIQDQLALRNRRTNSVLKILLWLLIAIVAFQLLLALFGTATNMDHPITSTTQSVLKFCEDGRKAIIE